MLFLAILICCDPKKASGRRFYGKPMNMFKGLVIKFGLGLVVWAGLMGNQSIAASLPSHTLWDELLQSHVNDLGWVDYEGFIADSTKLNQYLNELEVHPPKRGGQWTRKVRMAYWINAYNAYTVKLVADNYPVESIKDIGPRLSIPFVNTVWDIKFIRIGKEKLDLNKIEHKKLRKQFKDPRIHFAVVCASYSCPRLLNRAFMPETLNEQLDMMARDFIADTRKNKVESGELQLSKIFNWYGMDFKSKEFKTIIAYIQQYTDVEIDEDANVEWLDYQWTLNKQN